MMRKWLLFVLQLLQIAYTSCESCDYKYVQRDYYQITEKWWREEKDPFDCAQLRVCWEFTSIDTIYKGDYYDCFAIVSSNITTLSSLVNIRSAWGVKLDSNYIKHLKNDTFAGLVDLQEVSVRHNNINMLPDGLFISNSDLKIVDLSYNTINTIGNATFSDSIEYLNLMHNKLEKLDFHLPDSLINLEISYNMISYILETSFQKRSDLNTINLGNNMLTTLSPLLFPLCKNLLTLNLSNNSLSSINFALPASLTHVDFSFNSITFIDKRLFYALRNVHTISINNNLLKTLPDGLFDPLQHLLNVSLQHNKITTFPKDLFVSNHKLHNLRLDANNLESVNFYLPLAFIFLDLSYNSISRIEPNSFFYKPNLLGRLNLNNNLLQNLPLGCFYSLQELNTLSLSNNKINLTYGVFGGLKNLVELHIANNSIKYLPELSLNDLKSLSLLDVSYNSISTINTTDITEHLNNLRSIRLEGNTFKCSYLAKLIAQFRKSGVEVEEGHQFFESNVRGIECISNEFIATNDDTTENQENTSKDTTELKVFVKEVIAELCNRNKQLQEVQDNASHGDTTFSYYTSVLQTILLLGIFVGGILMLLFKYKQHRKYNRPAISLTEMRSVCNVDC